MGAREPRDGRGVLELLLPRVAGAEELLPVAAHARLLLHLGEAREVRVGHQLVWHRTTGLHEDQSQFLQARVAVQLRQAAPPVICTKILARQGKFAEVVLQQQPRALGIRALGKQF